MGMVSGNQTLVTINSRQNSIHPSWTVWKFTLNNVPVLKFLCELFFFFRRINQSCRLASISFEMIYCSERFVYENFNFVRTFGTTFFVVSSKIQKNVPFIAFERGSNHQNWIIRSKVVDVNVKLKMPIFCQKSPFFALKRS